MFLSHYLLIEDGRIVGWRLNDYNEDDHDIEFRPASFVEDDFIARYRA
jgi:hypothetical protein